MHNTFSKSIESLIKIAALFLALFLFSLSVFATGPTNLSYQAKIYKPDDSALEATDVDFRFIILNSAENCILYSEEFNNVNMAGTGGLKSFILGSGTQTYVASGTTITGIFDNTVPSYTCGAGSGVGAYAPSASHGRKIQMIFRESGLGWQTLPPMAVNSVPYASYAYKATLATSASFATRATSATSALSLNGYTENDFATSAGLGVCPGGEVLTYTVSGFDCVPQIGGSSSTVTALTANAPLVKTGTASSPILSITQSTSATDGYLSSTDWTTFNNKLSATSAAITTALGAQPLTASSTITLTGDVTGITTSNTVATVGGKTAAQVSTSVDDTLAASAAATANTIAKRDASGNIQFNNIGSNITSVNQLRLFNGLNSISFLSPVLATSYTLTFPASAGAVGQVLTTDGAGILSWSSPSAGSVIAVSGTVNEVSVTGAASNPVIGLANNGVTSGTYTKVIVDSKGRVTSGTQLASSDVTTALGFTPANSTSATQWTTSGTSIFYNTGNVGIGVSSPSVKLSILDTTTNSVDPVFNVTNTVTSGWYIPLFGGHTPNVTPGGRTQIAFGRSPNSGNRAEIDFTYDGDASPSNRIEMGFWDNNAILNILYSGRVGIGTTTPATTLDVSGTLRFAGIANTPVSGGVLTSDASGNATWRLPATGTVTNVSATAPLVSTGGATPTLSITQATSATNGYLSLADWLTFNNKVTTVSGTQYFTLTGTTSAPVIDLADIGLTVVSGAQYTKVTVDGKGRVTSGAQLAASDVTTALGFTPANSVSASQWTTSGTSIFYNTGSVGIGVSAPIYPLHVISSAANPLAIRNSAASGKSALLFENSAGTLKGSIGWNNTSVATNPDSLEVGTFSTQPLVLLTNSIERIRVESSGRVGIGTSSPATTLDVSGTLRFAGSTTPVSGGVLTSDASGNATWRLPASVSASQWTTTGSDIYYNTGNVGVGTATPAQKIDVSGTIKSGVAVANGISLPALLVTGGADNSTTNRAIAIKGESEKDIRLFADGGYSSIGMYYRNSDDSFNLTHIFGSTAPTETWSEYNQSGTSETVYSNFKVNLASGNTSIGGNLNVGGSSIFAGSLNGPSNILTVSGTLRSGVSVANGSTIPAIYVAGGGVNSSTDRPIALRGDSDRDMRIFADGGYNSIGQYYRNSDDSMNFTYLTSSNAVDSWTEFSQAGSSETVYSKFKIDLSTGNTSIGGNLGIGLSTPTAKLDVSGTLRFAGSTTPVSGGVLTSDASGNATWRLPSSASGTSQWTTSGTSIFYNTGNVGIGTSSPVSALHVSGTITAGPDITARTGSANARLVASDGKFIADSTVSNFGQFQIGNPTSNGEASLAFISGVTQYGDYGTNDSVNGSNNIWIMGPGVWGTNGNVFSIANKGYYQNVGPTGNVFSVNSSGNVGIGTDAPSTKLHLYKDENTGNEMYVQNMNAGGSVYSGIAAETNAGTIGLGINSAANQSGDGYLWLDTARDFKIGVSNTEVFRIKSSGNVGIGTNNPAALLDVNGNSNFGGSTLEKTDSIVGISGAHSISNINQNIVRRQLTGSSTITLPTAPTTTNSVYTLTIWVQQNATGGYTLSFSAPAGDNIAWDSDSSMPPVATGANKRTIYQFTKIQGDTTWYGSQVWKEN